MAKQKPKNNSNILLQKIRIHLLHWKFSYMLAFGALILLYVYITHQDNWTYVKRFGIKLPLHYEYHGIDISHHNDTIDWKKFRANQTEKNPIAFCFVKATEGGSLKDEDFQRNWKEVKKSSLIRGAYHFYVPMTNPQLQAQNFIQTVTLEEGDFAPVLDFEHEGKTQKTRKNLTENIQIWLELVEKHYGMKPIIYTNKYIYNTYIKGNFDEYPLWISDYDSYELKEYEEAKLLFWQHNTNGYIKGIREKVDFNVFLGSKNELNKLRL